MEENTPSEEFDQIGEIFSNSVPPENIKKSERFMDKSKSPNQELNFEQSFSNNKSIA